MEIEDSQRLNIKKWPPEERPPEKRLRDHLLGVPDRYFSFADEGLL